MTDLKYTTVECTGGTFATEIEIPISSEGTLAVQRNGPKKTISVLLSGPYPFDISSYVDLTLNEAKTLAKVLEDAVDELSL